MSPKERGSHPKATSGLGETYHQTESPIDRSEDSGKLLEVDTHSGIKRKL